MFKAQLKKIIILGRPNPRVLQAANFLIILNLADDQMVRFNQGKINNTKQTHSPLGELI